jgi:hypothetical protein
VWLLLVQPGAQLADGAPMSPRLRAAIKIGAMGAWFACVLASIAIHHRSHAAAAVLGLASMPWALLGLWMDRL